MALKNSVYLLPDTADTREDLRWLAQEIRTDGGQAIVVRAEILDGPSGAEIEARLAGREWAPETEPRAHRPDVGALRGRTWATRAGIKVDRMASAWLIRTRIDPQATFRFVTESERPAEGEVRFDMFEGEFTHVADRCTFEVLVDAFGLATDTGLVALGEIVHDLDCKDERFNRPEAAGVARMIAGIVARSASDQERLEAGAVLFDTLYRSFAAASSPAGA